MAIWSQYNGLDCHKCNSQIKKSRGCEKEIKPRVICGYEINRCPLKYFDERTSVFIQCYADYKNGFLPNVGGTLKQPCKFSSLMTTIGNIITRMEQDYGDARHKHKD